MKKILIFSQIMELGGAERALLGLLENIDYTKYTVDLFIMRHQGELMKHIPTQVNLLPEKKAYASLAVSVKQVLKNKQYAVLCGRVFGKFMAWNKTKKYNGTKDNIVGVEYSHKYTAWAMPQISNIEYDVAISFLTPHYFVDKKVKAAKKLAWIHTDYSNMELDIESELEMWDRYDNIVSISDSVTEGFIKVFPQLESKIIKIENILPQKLILSQCNAFKADAEMSADGIKLLSIGRYCRAKNFDNIPDICSKILAQGINVRWYVIGYGSGEKIIQEKIQQYNMQDRVILLGKKENPYPYIKACDLYVQPSRYEGKCVSVIEAQLLKKPVVITSYATAQSQLENGVDGLIVPMDNDGCARSIGKLIQNKELCEQLISSCKSRDYSNANEIEQLYSLLA